MLDNVTLAQITDCVDHINKDFKISLGCVGDAKLVLKQMIEEYKKQYGTKSLPNSEKVSELINSLI